MHIGIIGSMQHSDAMIEIADKLRGLGHEPILSLFVIVVETTDLSALFVQH